MIASPCARLSQAGRITFVIHLLKTGFALAVLPRFDAWSADLGTRRALGWLLRLLRLGSVSLPNTTTCLVAALVLWLLAAPLLAMLWLDAMAEPGSSSKHLRMAAARYPAALGVSLCCTAYLALAGTGGVGIGFAVHRALAFTHDTRLQDIAAVLAALPLATLALHAATLQDTALSALALRAPGVRAAMARGLRAASAGTLLVRAGFSAIELLATLALGLLPRVFFGLGPGASVGVLVITQIGALLVTCLRGYWLASAMVRVEATTTLSNATLSA